MQENSCSENHREKRSKAQRNLHGTQCLPLWPLVFCTEFAQVKWLLKCLKMGIDFDGSPSLSSGITCLKICRTPLKEEQKLLHVTLSCFELTGILKKKTLFSCFNIKLSCTCLSIKRELVNPNQVLSALY